MGIDLVSAYAETADNDQIFGLLENSSIKLRL